MPMPEDLYLVRHGESEGNLVNRRSRAGDDRARSICPWDLSLSSNDWRPVVRRTYSNEELLEMAAEYPRLFAG